MEEGKLAIIKVILNRHAHPTRWPNTVEGVIYQRYQFSWTLDKALFPLKDYRALLICVKSAIKGYAQWVIGMRLQKANHYFNPNIVLPSWAKKMKFIKKIGNHDFYFDG